MCNWESQQAPLTARAEVIQKRLANSERVSTYTKYRNKASHADHSNQLAVPHAAVPQCFIGSGNMSHLHRANSPLLFIFFFLLFLSFFFFVDMNRFGKDACHIIQKKKKDALM